MVCTINIEFFGGMTPVQCWGNLSGRKFYFRARWDKWSFEVGDIRHVPAVSDADEQALVFHRFDHYGNGPYDAGYMSFFDSRRIVADCIAQYAVACHDDNYDQVRDEVYAWFDNWLQTYPGYELTTFPSQTRTIPE